MEQLQGRTAVVTGAASGIGLAITEAFSSAGINVAMADRAGDALHEQASRLSREDGNVFAVVTDVTDPEAVERLAQTAVDTFGALHIAVNNAGIVNRATAGNYHCRSGTASSTRTFGASFTASAPSSPASSPRARAACGSEEGHVVNIGSLASVMIVDGIGLYLVAKHGVLGLSDILRAELVAAGAPIGVSLVMPGGIRTALNPASTVTTQQVAANVMDALRRGRAYVFTDDNATTEGGGAPASDHSGTRGRRCLTKSMCQTVHATPRGTDPSLRCPRSARGSGAGISRA